MRYKILVVDDEPANLRLLERLFSGEYDVVTATSGGEGLELLALHEFAVIISDQRMPSMTGVEFLKRAADMRSQTVRIILSGHTDVDDLVESINSGVVYKYITKPWLNPDLQQTVRRAMEYYETLRNQFRLKHENERLETRLKTTIRGFVNFAMEMLDMRHPEVSQHARRTARYAQAIGESLGIEDRELEQLFMAAFLHEVAHIRIPGHLLSGAASLRGTELRLFLDYFNRGVKFLGDIPDFKEIAEVVSFQHEHFDGSGYPNNLTEDQIPLHSRIIAIADAYDEMREPRLPIEGFDHESALIILKSAAGRKYDPELISVFCNLEFKEIGVGPIPQLLGSPELVAHV
jgi:response regulator RpfG family c-di-GMP phosphodiesterase